ncbi:MAG: S49 family peptidase [Syntrophobacteraceae bacterium]
MPDDRLLMHVAGRVLNTPLLIAQAKLNAILGFLGPRVGLPQAVLSGETEPAAIAQSFPVEVAGDDPSSSLSGIGVIRIFGTLVHRTKGFEGASGILSYEQIRAELNALLADPLTKAILLEVDFSGVEVAGAFDLVEEIYQARGVKPIIALSNEHAFSGAYAIASAADELFIARTGGVGSVGVLAVHMDQSQYDAKNGFKYTTLFEGARKNDFSPHEPLSDAALGAFRERLRSIYDLFVMTVARNRGLDPAAVRSTEAGLYFRADGVREGLADKVMSTVRSLAIPHIPHEDTILPLQRNGARVRRRCGIRSPGSRSRGNGEPDLQLQGLDREAEIHPKRRARHHPGGGNRA